MEQKRNRQIFEIFSNFDINPQDVTIPVENYVLKKMPVEVSEQLFVWANSHFKLRQYAEYDSRTNRNPQLSFWDSVYFDQLSRVEDYECPECDCDSVDQAVRTLITAGALVTAVTFGALSFSALFAAGGSSVWQLPAGIAYIDVLAQAVRGQSLETVLPYTYVEFPKTIGTVQTPFPLSLAQWNYRPPGEVFTWTTRYSIGSDRFIRSVGVYDYALVNGVWSLKGTGDGSPYDILVEL